MGEAKKPPPAASCSIFSIYGAIFRRRASLRHSRSSSTSCLPHIAVPDPDPKPVKRRTGSMDTTVVLRPEDIPVVPATMPAYDPQPVVQKPARVQPGPLQALPASKPAPVPGNGISGELESMLYDYQKANGGNKLVRATSGNVMLHGNLGNIRTNQSSDKDPKNGCKPGTNRATGNVVPKREMDTGTDTTVVLSRGALSKTMDPEELKELGNMEFTQGRFAEALALYDRAAVLDPGKATYWSNKAAALTGLGRILEAAGECQEAVRIDPAYYRAHNRLANLYFR